jgi:hypothetical protein
MIVLVLAFATACSSKDKPADPEPTKGSDTAPVPKADPPPANSGLAAKDNDPAVVALAKAAITCKVDDKQLDWSCPGFKAWRDSDLLKDGKADMTLVNLLEDGDEKVRFLGADKLPDSRSGYGEDPAAAKRVLAAAQRETSALVAERLGKTLGNVNLEKTGITAEVTKLIAEHELVDLRVGLIGTGQHANSRALFDAVFAQAKTATDDKIRLRAVTAFWVGTPSDKQAEVCQMWLDTADHANVEIAGEAAYMCGLQSNCKAHWDGLLDKLDGKTKAGKVGHTQMASALEWLHNQKEATAPQKQRAIAIARAVAENAKNAASARARAIDFLAKKAKDDSKTLFAKLQADTDASVKAAAERALK